MLISVNILFLGDFVINKFIDLNQKNTDFIINYNYNNYQSTIRKISMLTKKNYKQQQHFTRLHTFSVIAPATPTQPPRKYQVYFKRYRKQKQSENLYNLIYSQNDKKQQKSQTTHTTSKYSEDRTLELISFDGNLGFLKKYIRKIGKIRQYQIGEGLYKGNKVFTAMCVFKFQFDLVKCFRQEYLQTKIDQECLVNAKAITEDDREAERCELIQKHMQKELTDKLSKIKQMQADGFQVVTDIYGQYRMDYDANQKFVQNLPQIKKKQKKQEKQKKLKEELTKEKILSMQRD